jgi:exodeoxyribonuclease VII small subunit
MTMPEELPQQADAPASFEAALAQLEDIVHDLEEGQIGLDQSLARYEQGVKLLRQCYGLLQSAERKIELLTRVGPTGEAITAPFDDSPTAAPTGGSETTTRGRRSAKAAKPPAGDAPAAASESEEFGSLF